MTDTKPYRVRVAREEDRGDVTRLAKRLSAFPIPPWRTADEVTSADTEVLGQRSMSPADSYVTIVAESAEQCIGFCHVEMVKDFFSRDQRAHLSMIAVDDRHLRRGIGKALIKAAEAWAASSGLSRMSLNVFATNSAARAMYEDIGFAVDTVSYIKQL